MNNFEYVVPVFSPVLMGLGITSEEVCLRADLDLDYHVRQSSVGKRAISQGQVRPCGIKSGLLASSRFFNASAILE